eukprot:4303989-Pyramimonas_sp.AAC.2
MLYCKECCRCRRLLPFPLPKCGAVLYFFQKVRSFDCCVVCSRPRQVEERAPQNLSAEDNGNTNPARWADAVDHVLTNRTELLKELFSHLKRYLAEAKSFLTCGPSQLGIRANAVRRIVSSMYKIYGANAEADEEPIDPDEAPEEAPSQDAHRRQAPAIAESQGPNNLSSLTGIVSHS